MKFLLRETILIVLICGLVSGCESKSGASKDGASEERGVSAIPADVFVDAMPGEVLDVQTLKADGPRKGEVVVRGRIGGRARPFVEGAAVFVLVDSNLKSCNELHGDKCKTPWDYCCETPESIAANTATVQIVGDDGKPIRASAMGAHGLAPLKEVVVRGEIAEGGDAGNLVINVRSIHVSSM